MNPSDMITPRNWTLCGQSDGITSDGIQTSSNEVQIHFTSGDIRGRNTTGMGFKLHYATSWKGMFHYTHVTFKWSNALLTKN